MKKYKNKQDGLIRMIILIVVAIAVLSWYGVDLKEFFTSPEVRNNFGYVWNFLKDVWSTYLTGPAHTVWGMWLDHVWIPLFK
jgi:hypothetical protein